MIDSSIYCVHGGLSPSIHTLDQIRIIDRFKEIPHEGPMADLVWSDPINNLVEQATNTRTGASFVVQDKKPDFSLSPRGAGYVFGAQVTQKFLYMNDLSHICRAHQLCMEGYQVNYIIFFSRFMV